jgi:hypothetical protein
MSRFSVSHDWLIHVLDDLQGYASHHDMPSIAAALGEAHRALSLSAMPSAARAAQIVEQAWFVDTLRDLIDYTEAHGLDDARAHLEAGLSAAPREWERAQGLRVPIPARDVEG